MLTVPFLVQLVGVVGVVGYISYRNGQAAINEVTSQLRSEVSLRTQETLINYLEAPQVINRINVEMIRDGQVGLDDPDELARLFWDQTSLFDTIEVSAIYFGGETGEFLGMGFQSDETWQVGRVDASTDYRFQSYAVDDKGNPIRLLDTGDPYDPRVRPWYEWAVAVGREAWSDIYIDFKEPRLKLTHAIPVFSSVGELQGVVGVDVVLTHVQQFLRDLNISESGEIFIIERSGLLVASSNLEEEPFLVDENGQVTDRLAGDRSQIPLIRETTQYLRESLGDLHRLQDSQQLSARLVGERQFIQVTPLSDRQGINWLIVVVVPESDFMARIHANTRITILLCLGALGITVVGGVVTARWVGQPILTINQAAQEFAQGRWHNDVKIDRADELGELATAFNHMANQLQTYFTTLETQNQLMMEVNERLQQSLDKESKLTEAAGRFVPNQFLQLLGYDSIAEVHLGDTVSQEMTILFCDIRNFTRLSERMTPEDNFRFINSFLSQMEPPIVRHRGLIDKYIGDAIMALFGKTADDAITASIEMLHALAGYNTTRQRPDRPPIQMGIGINTGALILGVVGGENRIDSTVIGDAVNLASRVEKMTKRYRVPLLITEYTYMSLQDPDRYCLRMIDQVIPRGRSERVTIFEIFDADTPALLEAKKETRSPFEQAVQLYSQAQVKDALPLFETCLHRCPEDTAAQVYVQACQRLLTENVNPMATSLDNI
jgi:class 3 adenylate cyclase/HAMP domain-containing protein